MEDEELKKLSQGSRCRNPRSGEAIFPDERKETANHCSAFIYTVNGRVTQVNPFPNGRKDLPNNLFIRLTSSVP